MANLFKEVILSIAYKAVEVGFNIIEKLDEECYDELDTENSLNIPHNQMILPAFWHEDWGVDEDYE